MTTGLTSSETSLVASVPSGLLIGGHWVGSRDGGTLTVVDPATGLPFAAVADAAVADARAALDAAVSAQPDWSRTPPRDRAEILRRAFELVIERSEDLAEIITLEMGKPLQESRAEVAYAAEFFRWFSEEAVRLTGSWLTAPDGQSRLITMRQAVGPCLLILPWNVPLAMGTRKIGPAIAAGCTMVVKPARQTPLSMNALAVILHEAGLPDGVLNVIPTSHPSEVVAELMNDSRLRKVSFTGSTRVGQELVRHSAARLLRLSMELGGNAPFIVFDDADITLAVDEAMKAKLRNNGEACTAANRFYVHEKVIGDFTAALRRRFEDIVVGRGTQPGVTLGPLIDRSAVLKVSGLVDQALAEGANVAYAGSIPNEKGFYFPPMILSDVRADSPIVSQEIFGPVAPIVSFADDQEVVDWANQSSYGLSAYIFTQGIKRAIRVTEALEVGMVGLNKGVVSNPAAPFGGVKMSGFGREGGFEGVAEYLETKYLGVNA